MRTEIAGIYGSIINNIARNRVPVADEIHPYTLNDGGVLGNVECPICNNTGRVITKDGFNLTVKECRCMNVRRAKKRLKESGLIELLDEYTMQSYKTVDQWTNWARAKATEYINATKGWFYIHGVPGSGKTHLCTAICSELMQKGKIIRYVIWPDLVKELNSVINDSEYERVMHGLKDAEVLYIDDFLKGNASDAESRRAFEVINARYNIPSKKTIISSEKGLNYVADVDPAVAGRINQRSRGFYLKTPDKDWRLSM